MSLFETEEAKLRNFRIAVVVVVVILLARCAGLTDFPIGSKWNPYF